MQLAHTNETISSSARGHLMKTKLNRFLSYALTLLMVALAATSTEAQELEWTLAGVSPGFDRISFK